MRNYQIIEAGIVLSGIGRNRGTQDSTHSRSAAYRHARKLRKEGRKVSVKEQFTQ